MGKSTISMAIFHCYVSSPEGNPHYHDKGKAPYLWLRGPSILHGETCHASMATPELGLISEPWGQTKPLGGVKHLQPRTETYRNVWKMYRKCIVYSLGSLAPDRWLKTCCTVITCSVAPMRAVIIYAYAVVLIPRGGSDL